MFKSTRWLFAGWFFILAQVVALIWFEPLWIYAIYGFAFTLVMFVISSIIEIRKINKSIKKSKRELRRLELKMFIHEQFHELLENCDAFQDMIKPQENKDKKVSSVEAWYGKGMPIKVYIDGKLQSPKKKRHIAIVNPE
jgi:hypothetical protein